MSEKEQYVAVRIPKFFDDLISKYIEAHREEMRLLGLRASRAGVVKKALYEFFKKEGIIKETPHSVKIQGDTSNPDGLLVHVRETFLVHSIIEMAKEKKLPRHHSDPKQLEQKIRRYITIRAKQEGKKITQERLDELTEDILKYHKEIFEGLALSTKIQKLTK